VSSYRWYETSHGLNGEQIKRHIPWIQIRNFVGYFTMNYELSAMSFFI